MTATTPAPVPTTSPTRTHATRRAAIVTVVVLGALGLLLWRGLDEAAVYFYRADEAVAKREELGQRRFRLEGIVVAGSTRTAGEGVRFQVEENGATVDVVHHGDPPELFRAGIPVVLEGRWSGARFASDHILVKHTSEYRKDNPERVKDYETERS